MANNSTLKGINDIVKAGHVRLKLQTVLKTGYSITNYLITRQNEPYFSQIPFFSLEHGSSFQLFRTDCVGVSSIQSSSTCALFGSPRDQNLNNMYEIYASVKSQCKNPGIHQTKYFLVLSLRTLLNPHGCKCVLLVMCTIMMAAEREQFLDIFLKVYFNLA